MNIPHYFIEQLLQTFRFKNTQYTLRLFMFCNHTLIICSQSIL